MKIFLQTILFLTAGLICYNEYRIPPFKLVKSESDFFEVKNKKIIKDSCFVVVTDKKNNAYCFKTADLKIPLKKGNKIKISYKLYSNADGKKLKKLTSVYVKKRNKLNLIKIQENENFNQFTHKIPKNTPSTLE